MRRAPTITASSVPPPPWAQRSTSVTAAASPSVTRWWRRGGQGCSSQPSLRHLLQLPPLLLLLFSVGGAEAAPCPDGSAGLTRALYEGVGPAAYANVTCIPEREFEDYDGNVTLSGLAFLTSIEAEAFYSFRGTLAITGEYPSLETVGEKAFEEFDERHSFHFRTAESESAITFTGLPLLKQIESSAFSSFQGTLAITGEYPALETVGAQAFNSAGTAKSAITFNGLPLLKQIERSAFYSFKGTLAITGEFPSLETVEEFAFQSAGTAESKVDLSGLNSAKLEKIHYEAFYGFTGSVKFPAGPFPNYSGCTRMGNGLASDPDVVLHAPTQIPLTKTLYEAAAAAADGGARIASFSNVTCIPDGEFSDYARGDVTLDTGLESLQSIGESAFFSFKGTLAITGEYPSLVTVGGSAFQAAGTAESAITFSGLPLLKQIEASAFRTFEGTLAITGEYPSLETVGEFAFYGRYYGTAKSAITFTGLPLLKEIERSAFFRFEGTLAITGEYPSLETVGEWAFESAGTAESTVAIACSSRLGLTVAADAFDDFKGTPVRTGEQTPCPETTKTTTTTPTSTSSTASTTTTSFTTTSTATSASCASGWDGPNCQTAKQCTAGADGQACANGGVASGAIGACGCACAAGWDGANCGTATTTTTSTTTSATTATSVTPVVDGTTSPAPSSAGTKLNVGGGGDAGSSDPAAAAIATNSTIAGTGNGDAGASGTGASTSAVIVAVVVVAVLSLVGISVYCWKGRGATEMAAAPAQLVVVNAGYVGPVVDEAGYQVPVQRQSNLYDAVNVARVLAQGGGGGGGGDAISAEYAAVGQLLQPGSPSAPGRDYAPPSALQMEQYDKGVVPGLHYATVAEDSRA